MKGGPLFIHFSLRPEAGDIQMDKQNSLLGYLIWIDNSIFNCVSTNEITEL